MSKLTKSEQELILDFYFRCGEDEHINQGRDLIAKNPEAAELYTKFEETLTGLDSIKYEPCPDNLVEITVERLLLAAAGTKVQPNIPGDTHPHVEKLSTAAVESQHNLERLIAGEQSKELFTKTRFWTNAGKLLATAAVILFVFSLYFPTLRHARRNSWQQLCQMQLARIGNGIRSYSSDHNGKLPAVATTAGAPWWKVGYKPESKENFSNTRHIWLLVRNGYVKKPSDFVCPGRRQGRVIQLKQSDVDRYNDFPARRYITFSLQLRPIKSRSGKVKGLKVVMADLNPLFEKLPRHTNPLSLNLNSRLSNLNSVNHNRKGQNVLFSDGNVAFQKNRYINSDVNRDDIFTLQGTTTYKGCELPTSDADAFLAP